MSNIQWEHPLIQAARDFAIKAHADTNHLYDGKPYQIHLERVVAFACSFGSILNEEDLITAVAGAWVHDTIEDTRVTYNDVKAATSKEVAEIAFALTNEKGRTRKERANARYYEGIRANKVALYVKLCDRLANASYSFETGSRMLEVYQKERQDFGSLFTSEFTPMWERLDEILFQRTRSCGGG